MQVVFTGDLTSTQEFHSVTSFLSVNDPDPVVAQTVFRRHLHCCDVATSIRTLREFVPYQDATFFHLSAFNSIDMVISLVVKQISYRTEYQPDAQHRACAAARLRDR